MSYSIQLFHFDCCIMYFNYISLRDAYLTSHASHETIYSTLSILLSLLVLYQNERVYIQYMNHARELLTLSSSLFCETR